MTMTFCSSMCWWMPRVMCGDQWRSVLRLCNRHSLVPWLVSNQTLQAVAFCPSCWWIGRCSSAIFELEQTPTIFALKRRCFNHAWGCINRFSAWFRVKGCSRCDRVNSRKHGIWCYEENLEDQRWLHAKRVVLSNMSRVAEAKYVSSQARVMPTMGDCIMGLRQTFFFWGSC